MLVLETSDQNVVRIRISFVLGLAFGAIAKHAIKLGIILVMVIILLIAFGVVASRPVHTLDNLHRPRSHRRPERPRTLYPCDGDGFCFWF